MTTAASVLSRSRGYDVIVIGAGITGTALSYELAKLGMRLLLLEAVDQPQNATRRSYGGIAYWAGTTPETAILCEEGITIHRSLSEELDAATGFRELPLLSTIALGQDAESIAQRFRSFSQTPQRLTPQEAQDFEPLLNPQSLEAVLVMPYAQIHPAQTALAYQQAMLRLGGEFQIDRIQQLRVLGDRVEVQGLHQTYLADQVIVCAGGGARSLLVQSGYAVPQYFSHDESIETDRSDLTLRSVVMPAEIRRLSLERQVNQYGMNWDEPIDCAMDGALSELGPMILDGGALQFGDGSFRFGQISRLNPGLTTQRDAIESERAIRQSVGQILPQIAALPGRWVTCTVAFSADHRPFVGTVGGQSRLQIFSGFSNPMALFPATARRFAQQIHQGKPDPVLLGFDPDRVVSGPQM